MCKMCQPFRYFLFIHFFISFVIWKLKSGRCSVTVSDCRPTQQRCPHSWLAHFIQSPSLKCAYHHLSHILLCIYNYELCNYGVKKNKVYIITAKLKKKKKMSGSRRLKAALSYSGSLPANNQAYYYYYY